MIIRTEKTVPSKLLLEDVLERSYLREFPNTHTPYVGEMRGHLARWNALGHACDIREIDDVRLSAFRQDCIERGMSHRTADRHLKTIQTLLEHCRGKERALAELLASGTVDGCEAGEPCWLEQTLDVVLEGVYRRLRPDQSPQTIEKMSRHITAWKRVIGVRSVKEIDRDALLRYRESCMERGLAVNTINTHIRTIITVVTSAGHILDTDGLKLRPPVPRLAVSHESFHRLWASTDHARWPVPRTADRRSGSPIHPSLWWRALFMLELTTGLKRTSLFNLTWNDVEDDRIRIAISGRGERYVPIPMRLRPWLKLLRASGTRTLLGRTDCRAVDQELRHLADVAGIEAIELSDLRSLAAHLWERAGQGCGRMVVGGVAGGHSEESDIDVLREAADRVDLPSDPPTVELCNMDTVSSPRAAFGLDCLPPKWALISVSTLVSQTEPALPMHYPRAGQSSIESPQRFKRIVPPLEQPDPGKLRRPDVTLSDAVHAFLWANRGQGGLEHKEQERAILERFARLVETSRQSMESPPDAESCVLLRDLTTHDVKQVMAARKTGRGRNGGELAPATLNKEVRYIRVFLRCVSDDRKTYGLPPDWQIPQVPFVRELRRIPRSLSPELLEEVFESCKHARRPRLIGVTPADWWQTLLYMAFSTSLRRRALFELVRPTDDELNRETLFIPAELDKSGQDRIYPLTPAACEAIRRMPAQPGEPLFDWPYNMRALYAEMERMQLKQGIPLKSQARLHDLRRTTATHLVSQGESMSLVQRQLAHSPGSSVTSRFYIGVLTDQQRTAVNKLMVPRAVSNFLKPQWGSDRDDDVDDEFAQGFCGS